MKVFTKPAFTKVFPWILVVGGIVGLLASSVLTIEKFNLAANPDHIPSCSISPIVACSPVMNSWQANTFKIPNMFIGLAGFGMVWSVGMMLFAGADKMRSWFWRCFLAGTAFGVLFVTWLQYSSIYDIKKLCIYCMVVWVVTVPIFWTTAAYSIREGHIKFNKKIDSIVSMHPGKFIAVHYLIVVALILLSFSDYFYSLI